MALHLQRTVGNTAFRSLLQRDPTLGWDPTPQNKDFKRTKHTDPNRTVQKNGVSLRSVLLNGLKHGLTEKDDKTGTLTSGHMTVTSIRLGSEEVEVSGVGFAPEGGFSAGGGPIDPARHAELLAILRVAALASRGDVTIEREPREGEPWVVHGDPTEAALVVAARKAGLDPERLRREWPEIGEVPFSSERRFMATFHRTPRGIVACLKGAPRRVLELSRITPDRRNALLDVNREMAGRGLRILAIATALVDRPDEAALGALDFLGFVGMSDPPAPGVPQTIRAFAGAGIRTVMLTGDQQRTAEAIAARLGLLSAGRRGLDGRAVDRMTDGELTGVVGDTVVFSRVSPEAKLRIVAAYQRRDDVVAMLGDGVNDAAALRQADIGVAMGLRGTDLAKEAADLVLADDRFPTIAAAVEEGRVIFDNLRKFVFYLFSCNLAEILVLLGAGLAGAPAVLLPLQILWLNLLTDTLPALALAAEPGEPGIMRQPPRDPRAGILSGRAIRATVGYAALIASVSLAAYVWGNRAGGPALGSTMTFMTLALAQIFHLGNARSVGPVLRPRAVVRNRFALGAVALAVGLQLLTVGDRGGIGAGACPARAGAQGAPVPLTAGRWPPPGRCRWSIAPRRRGPRPPRTAGAPPRTASAGRRP
jgi:Ca2+-transporting ATPase